jgi:hypothetical protein
MDITLDRMECDTSITQLRRDRPRTAHSYDIGCHQDRSSYICIIQHRLHCLFHNINWNCGLYIHKQYTTRQDYHLRGQYVQSHHRSLVHLRDVAQRGHETVPDDGAIAIRLRDVLAEDPAVRHSLLDRTLDGRRLAVVPYHAQDGQDGHLHAEDEDERNANEPPHPHGLFDGSVQLHVHIGQIRPDPSRNQRGVSGELQLHSSDTVLDFGHLLFQSSDLSLDITDSGVGGSRGLLKLFIDAGDQSHTEQLRYRHLILG